MQGKEVYRIYTEKQILTKLMLSLIFGAFFQGLFNNALLGLAIGASISGTMIFLEKMKYPGYMYYLYQFLITPKYLSSNKYYSESENTNV